MVLQIIVALLLLLLGCVACCVVAKAGQTVKELDLIVIVLCIHNSPQKSFKSNTNCSGTLREIEWREKFSTAATFSWRACRLFNDDGVVGV